VSRSLFVYWKIDAGAAGPALERAREAQATLRARWPALDARLWLRDGAAAQATVMETYAAAGGIDAAAQAQIEAVLQHALAGLPAGERHVEVFRPA
jgi:hypothetical protein